MTYAVKKVKGGYKVQNTITKRFFSKDPLTKLMAEKQMKAIIMSEYHSHLNKLINKHLNHALGGNIITDLVNDGIDIVKNTVHNIISDPGHILYNTKSPQTDKILEQYGDFYISRMKIHRKPIEKILTDIVNAFTLGKFNESKYQFDQVFHLAIIIEIKNESGKTICLLTEKIPNIFWTEVKSLDDFESKDSYQIKVHPPLKKLSLTEVMNRVKHIMGDSFNTYDMKTNNCQNYVLNICQAVFNLNRFDLPKMVYNYIYQDLKKYITTFAQKIGKKITDTGHAFRRALFGGEKSAPEHVPVRHIGYKMF